MGVIGRAATLRALALASVVANAVIVVTGGAVRLSDSGLGCPTWPRCTDESLTPTAASAVHGVIEFSNRMLTFVLVAVALATWVCAVVQRHERRLASLALAGIPAQAVLGGFTVLTHLNPWLVGLHFLLSMGLLAVTLRLWWRLRLGTPSAVLAPAADRAARALGAATVAVALAVLVAGTVVTGAGPHAGDLNSSGKVHRNGLQVSSVAQLHADLVMVLIGLSVGLLALLAAVRAGRAAVRAAGTLVAVEVSQAGVGYAQYFLHVPPLLVALHMLGACLVWLAALRTLFVLRAPAAPPVEWAVRAPVGTYNRPLEPELPTRPGR